mmetsp:Transcript_91033/g.254329  ORF Transcript_91033/g.254329 Transcript_91033/m.254329 type:complete len:386 (+) Transcript_91033:943-2100(+)
MVAREPLGEVLDADEVLVHLLRHIAPRQLRGEVQGLLHGGRESHHAARVAVHDLVDHALPQHGTHAIVPRHDPRGALLPRHQGHLAEVVASAEDLDFRVVPLGRLRGEEDARRALPHEVQLRPVRAATNNEVGGQVHRVRQRAEDVPERLDGQLVQEGRVGHEPLVDDRLQLLPEGVRQVAQALLRAPLLLHLPDKVLVRQDPLPEHHRHPHAGQGRPGLRQPLVPLCAPMVVGGDDEVEVREQFRDVHLTDDHHASVDSPLPIVRRHDVAMADRRHGVRREVKGSHVEVGATPHLVPERPGLVRPRGGIGPDLHDGGPAEDTRADVREEEEVGEQLQDEEPEALHRVAAHVVDDVVWDEPSPDLEGAEEPYVLRRRRCHHGLLH